MKLFLLYWWGFLTPILPQTPPPNRNKEGFSSSKAVLSIGAWFSKKDQVMVERKMLKVKHRLNVTCYTIGKVFL